VRGMDEQSQKENEIDEIFTHIKQLKAEKVNNVDINQDDFESIKTIKKDTGTIGEENYYNGIPPEDIFRIIKPEDLGRESLSVMKVDVRSSGICDICGRDIIFDENLSGLTIRGEFFSCENCCRDASKETLDGWVEYKKGKPKDIIPIALWLMKEKKRTELFK
jgi:hypothetical protein